MESNGYAVQLTKTISLQGDQLTIAYELHNKGQKPFHTEEYIHNFIGIDGLNIGQDFELRLRGTQGSRTRILLYERIARGIREYSYLVKGTG